LAILLTVLAVVCRSGVIDETPAVAKVVATAAKSPVIVDGHKWGDSAGFYDAASGKQEKVIAVGRRPHESALSADGRRAYFTLYGLDLYTETVEGGRAVAVVDIPSRTKVGEIDLGKYLRPHGIEIGRNSGLLYVTCDHPAALVILDPQKNAVVGAATLTQPGSLCHMVSVSHDEKWAYVANCGTADISVIDLPNRREVDRIAIGGVPMGMALSHDGPCAQRSPRTGAGCLSP
jgi:DNA-binding beta-propeller fold protein YncE